MKTELDSIAENHFFWYCSAGQALCDMHRYAFDLDSNQFDLAQERFTLARSRANTEFKRFLEYTENVECQQDEETGQPL